ncbi:NAD(P)-dependent oxidoreductase [Pseudodesulfovibrio indicus]|uniref:NAD-dependent epimerase/dehydratase family protein n=1 Tax=Pseudodesulfovibrio indicus TaxID=1716143 RepID=UPI00292EBD47|nr:NAD(P)-dependent oxidoreductase [Pseudodesulfovibrio indicus]
MRILITGATGFIGDHVVRELVKSHGRGNEIVATSTSLEKAKATSWYSDVEYMAHDIYDRTVDPYELFKKPDVLIHLAWSGFPNYTQASHFEHVLFEEYRFHKRMIASGLKRLVYAGGTYAEYGNHDGCMKEEALSDPTTPYSIAKDTLRKMLALLAQDAPGFSLCWCRLFNVYGEGQNKGTFLAQLISAINNNAKTFNMSAGEQLRDFIPVGVAANRIAKLAAATEAAGIYNICSGVPTSLRALAETIIEQMNASIHLNLGHYPYNTHEPMAIWGDGTKYADLQL